MSSSCLCRWCGVSFCSAHTLPRPARLLNIGKTSVRRTPFLDSYWSHARSAGEVHRDLLHEAHPQQTGLLGAWSLREGEGSRLVQDATGAFRRCVLRNCWWEVRALEGRSGGQGQQGVCPNDDCGRDLHTTSQYTPPKQTRDDVPPIRPPPSVEQGLAPLLYPSSEPWSHRGKRMRVAEMTGAFDRAAVVGVEVRCIGVMMVVNRWQGHVGP